MNTGIQRSSTTCPGAWTTTTPIGALSKGKGEPAKYLPLLMMFQGVPYVATATVAYLLDFIEKLKKAMAVQSGMAYIHVHCPCPTGWRAATDIALELSKLAVQTNYFPLWEAENGRVKFTYQVENPKPVSELTRLMGRFEHLTEDGIDELQGMVNSRIELLKMLSK
jgi:pyruvate/2-oxoacid:ferredoxin oxidoreductase beta subunit